MAIETQQPTTVSRSAGRGLLFLGILLGLLSIALPAIQFTVLEVTRTPWYAAVLMSLGALLVLVSFVKRRSITRFVVLGLSAALAVFFWFALLDKLPEYHGPAQAGQMMPVFETTLANGSAFTDKDLQNDKSTVMVFFRGRW